MHKNTMATSSNMAEPIIPQAKFDWFAVDWPHFHEWKKAHEVQNTFHACTLPCGNVRIFARSVC